jgi:hypothetical protein
MSASTQTDRSVIRRGLGRVVRRMPFLLDTYRFVRHPSWQVALNRDLAATSRSNAGLRSVPRPGPGAPRTLISLYRDDIFDAKLGLLLGVSLRTQGLEPLVLVPSTRARRVTAYAKRFGVDDIVDREAVALSLDERRQIDDAVGQVRAATDSYERLKQWRFADLPAGYHLLSTVIRLTQDGSPDLSAPHVAELIETVARDVATSYVRSGRILDEWTPEVVLVEEAGYSVNGPLVDAAVDRGIDVIQTIPTWRDDALISKRLTAATRRLDTRAVPRPTFERLCAEPWSEDDEVALQADFEKRYGGTWALGAVTQSAVGDHDADLASLLDLDRNRPTAVVFAHVLWDASLFFGEDLFANYADWLVQCVGAAIANPRVNWVIKTHPANVFRARHGDTGSVAGEMRLLGEHHPTMPPHVHVLEPGTPVSARQLYAFADYGVTVRGTPGLEMACFAKQVFTAGTGAFSGLGFTQDSSSAAEFLDRMAHIEDSDTPSPEVTRLAKRYAHAAFLRLPWITESFEMSFDFAAHGWHPLDRNVRIRPDRVEDPIGADLARWASWVASSDLPDPIDHRRP